VWWASPRLLELSWEEDVEYCAVTTCARQRKVHGEGIPIPACAIVNGDQGFRKHPSAEALHYGVHSTA
jgi:hypothetical protein